MIVVPDDYPSVFEGSAAHERARALGEVRVHTGRGAEDEAELARRGFDQLSAEDRRRLLAFLHSL